MRFYLYLFLGLLCAATVIYKLAVCPSCDSSFLGYPISGYTDMSINTILATVLLNGAYRYYKIKQSAKDN